MKWKMALGLGVACAACCAFPLLFGAGALGALGVASGNGTAMLIGGLLLAATAAAYLVQRRRRRALMTACNIDGSCGCKPEGSY
ncbi:hypothetical protein [Sphingopyxis sp. R3-92]|uniref:hypothetical protein n=1 Tax=Sphingopyxis sp. R3-92 TaxID=3158553 RepID=UPI003EE640B2